MNSDPVADAGGPYVINQGDALFLDARGSYEPDAGDSITLYLWDLNGNGLYGDFEGRTETVTPDLLSDLGLGEGTHEIHLRVFDYFGFAGNDSTTVTVNPTAVNSPPAAVDDTYTTDEDTVFAISSPGVLANDTDPDSGGWVRFKFAGHITSSDQDFSFGDSFVGYYMVNPDADRFEIADNTLTYQYRSGNAAWELQFPGRGYRYVATSAYTWVLVGNDKPTFGDRYVANLVSAANLGTPLPSGRELSTAIIDLWDPVANGADLLSDDSLQTTSINLLAAEYPGGQMVFRDNTQAQLVIDELVGPLTVTRVNGQVTDVNQAITLTSGAVLRVLGNGSFSYDPRGAFDHLSMGGTATDSFTYEVSDPDGGKATATVEITIVGVNDAPVLAGALVDQAGVYGTAFGLTLAEDLFTDPDAGTVLTYAVSGLPAGLDFNPATRTFSGVPGELGTFPVTVTATDNGVPALSASTLFDIVVGKAPLTATADSFTRYYGEENPPLTGTLVSVVNGDNITATYSTTAMPTGSAGVYTIYVTLVDPDNRLGNYDVTTVNGALYVQPAPQTITFGEIPPHVYGDAPFVVPVSASSGLPVTLTSSAASVATVSGNTLTITGASTTLLTAYQPGDGNYQAATFVQISYTVGKGTPVITWAAPADINCQTVLGPMQLNATVNAAGTLTYNPPAGSTLPLGDGQVLSVNFAPADPGNWNPAAATTTVNVRLDAAMAVLWETATPNTPLSTVALAPDQQVAAIGYYSWGGSSHNYSVAKYSAADGSVVWQKSYDTPVNGYDEAKEGAVDAAGNVAVTGYSFVNGGNQDYLTARYAATDGTLLWVKRYNGAANADDQGRAVAVHAEGNVVVTGHSWNGSNWDIHTLKYASEDGAVLWEQHCNGPANGQDYGTVIAVDSAANVVIAGSSASDYYTAKYAAADGALLWQTTYTRGDDQIMSMAIDSQDNVIVTGFSSGPGTGYDYYTAKYAAADGSLVWGQRYNSPENRDEFGGSVVVDAAGNVIVAGHANSGSTSDYVTVKYAAQNGALLWERRFANQLGFLEGRTRLAVDAAGNAVFAGLIRHADNTRENYTVSYATADGSVQWDYRSPAIGNATRPVAVNPEGDVFTTGNATLLRLRFGTMPTITVNGEAVMTLELGTTFTDPGATATDGCGNTLSVAVIGSVDVQTAGDYSLLYSATDAAGQSSIAIRTVSVVITDHPPVAVLGEDITLLGGLNCEARYHFDASASYDPDGDELAYRWRVYTWNEKGQLFYRWTPPEYIDLFVGTYTIELTVSTTKDGVTLSSTATQTFTVLPGAPVLVGMSPTAAYANGPGFELRVTSGCFLEGATVYWNGSPRPTTLVWGNELAELVAMIPASDLQTGVDIAVATVHVVNGDGQISNPFGFSIVAQTVGTVDGAVSEPGETTTVSTAPTTEGEPGVSVTVENSGDEPVTVLAATYDEMPVGETAFRADNGAFVDVQVAGATEDVSATVLFYYPSDVTGGMENRVKLRYFDGTETKVFPQVAGSASATHLYAAPGVYGVTVQVMDAEGDLREGRFEYVVIYDPDGGFVTGGGWIDSPVGAYVFDPTLAGKATFGFVSKYKKGQSVPTGETQFQFQAGDFRFQSTAYEWLVVSGAKAQYKGVGDYGFLLTATDGQVAGGGGTDKFRIKIWDRVSEIVVYDNLMGQSDDLNTADPQVIGGGSIVIHQPK